MDKYLVKNSSGKYDYLGSAQQLRCIDSAPEKIDGDFWCEYNQLTTLVGSPKRVEGNFYCGFNRILSLAGAPSTICGDFIGRHNYISSLIGIHQKIRKLAGILDLRGNPIVAGGVGIVMITDIMRIEMDNNCVAKILNKYIGGNIFQCQNELIDAGYEDFSTY